MVLYIIVHEVQPISVNIARILIAYHLYILIINERCIFIFIIIQLSAWLIFCFSFNQFTWVLHKRPGKSEAQRQFFTSDSLRLAFAWRIFRLQLSIYEQISDGTRGEQGDWKTMDKPVMLFPIFSRSIFGLNLYSSTKLWSHYLTRTSFPEKNIK